MAHLAANTQVHEHTVALPVLEWTAFADQINKWAATRTPFFFMVDFEMQKPWAVELRKLYANNPLVWFQFPEVSNLLPHLSVTPVLPVFNKYPVSYPQYLLRFEKVMHHLKAGNSYLVNLTCNTRVETDVNWFNLFLACRARYKVYIPGKLMCFSPETFITIQQDMISTCPMKGTIDAAIPRAAQIILNDEKETAEHVTIVDLLRNDLSRVASKVTVEQFRYLTEIHAGNKRLLQVSSRRTGGLSADLRQLPGEIFTAMLPAGSVSGAPKPKTCCIIREAENEDRGYFTGICGIFNGRNLDSAVMIRYLEFTPNGIYYRSGGGITALSEPQTEYREMIDKVYVPVN